MKLKFDKNLAASVTLHVLVLGYGLVSFSSRSMEAPQPESMPVDIISADQLSKITAGNKSGEKDKPKPLVEKVADAKPVEDLVGKITPKPPVETEAALPKPPVEKPVEKKPDPPKPVAENKPKDEPKPIEKKPDPPKVDPIAEALKIRREQEAGPQARGQGCAAAAAAEAEGAGVRSDQDGGAARQARSDPAGRHRRGDELACLAWGSEGHRGDLVAIRA